MGEEEAAEKKNNMTIFRVGERKGGKKQKQYVIFLPNIHQLLNFLIKACHTHSNILQ
jgi:hypothetical protein